jgi:hypothetical protein
VTGTLVIPVGAGNTGTTMWYVSSRKSDYYVARDGTRSLPPRNIRANTAGYERRSASGFMARPLLSSDVEINPNGGETDGEKRDT